MAKLASLVVDLQLQSAQLRAGLDEANRRLEAFAKQTERTGNIIAGAFSFEVLKDGLGSLTEFIKGGADAADAMGELATSVGVPVAELSKLAYAATFSGSSTEAVGKALSKTAALMSKALAPTSEQAAMFQALGVSVTEADGRLRATEAVFSDIAQRFSETEDGAGKTALAIRLFGDEGAKLVPLLNNGKAGLAAFSEEAARTGNVITEKGAASAGQFNDALDRLKKAGEGLALVVAQDLAPSMAAFAEEVTTSKGSTEAFDTVASALATTFRVLASAGVAVATTVDVVGKSIAGAASWTAALFDDDAMSSRSGEAAAATGQAITESLEAEGRKFRAIWDKDGPGATVQKDAEKAKPSADAYVAAIERTKKAAEKAAEAQKELAEASRKAAEESAKALDDYVKSALALDRQHAATEREVAKRRAEFEGGKATDGFSDMENALDTLEKAQKAAATMRDRANVRDNAGDIIGADSATRKADELTALAERASAAVDAFRDLSKEAEDAATKALEAQIEAAASLERAFDGIDQEVAKRISEAASTGTNAGFLNFNEALTAMASALKTEATFRAQASALEREGKLGEARQAALVADANKVLADRAGAAADAFKEFDKAAREAAARVPEDLAGMLKPSGSAISATLDGVKTGAAAGPVGAVVGGLVGLLSQSEQFQGALADLETIFQNLANSVGKLVEPLLPLLTVVSEVAAGLGALIGALSPIVEFVARPLFEVLKALGMVILGIVKFIGEIINGIGEIFGFKNKLNLSGIDKAMERLEGSSYDAAKAQKGVADAARQVEGSLNVPSWWRVQMAEFNATDLTGTSSGGGRGTTVITDNSKTTIEVNGVTDPDEFAEKVVDRIQEKKKRRTGSRFDGEGNN